MGLRIHMSQGENSTIMGLIGDTTRVDAELIASLDAVEAVRRIQEPYKNANRKFHPADTVVDAGGVKIGGGHFQIIAGPCSVESETQMITVARAVKAAGATLLRGGAFKPRTSPYAFQGLHERGTPPAAQGQGGNGAAHCHRDHGRWRICPCLKRWT